MKKIILILLMIFAVVEIRGQAVKSSLWSLSGTTLNPISSAYKLGFTYPLRTGNKVQMSFTSDSTDYAPYELMTHSTDFEGVPDYTFSLGYNSSQPKVAEPIFTWNIENNYKVGATRYLESYFQYVGGGQTFRPIFMQFDKSNPAGTMGLDFMAASGVSFHTASNDSVYATLGKDGLNLNGYPGQAAGTSLNITSQNGKYSSIVLSGGLGIIPLANNQWMFQVNGKQVLSFLDTKMYVNNVSANGAFSVGVAAADKDALYTLFLKKVASQGTSLFRVVDENNNVYATISPLGYFTLGTHIANKRFNLGDGTDIYSMDIASDKIQFYNDNATPASIFSLDSLGNAAFMGSITGNSSTRGTNAFTTTAETDTVTITGASVNDFYTITLTGNAAPSANDAIRLEATATGFILHRSAAGTSGLTYVWKREK